MHPLLQAFLSQAAGAEAAPAQNPLVAFMPFVLIAIVFYLVFLRPQAKQAKKHQGVLAALKKGDEVVTQSGMIGVVHEVKDRIVVVDFGSGNKVRVIKAQVAGLWQEQQTPAEPAKAEAKK